LAAIAKYTLAANALLLYAKPNHIICCPFCKVLLLLPEGKKIVGCNKKTKQTFGKYEAIHVTLCPDT